MIKFRTKEEMFDLYEKRYEELDVIAYTSICREYDYLIPKLEKCTTNEEIDELFKKEIELNETRYKKNAKVEGVEASPYYKFQDIMAHYGMIVFFRDYIIKED